MWNTEETWKAAKNPDKALNIILRPHRLSMRDRLKMIFTMGRAQCMTKTVLASGENNHSRSIENNQFQSNKNNQSKIRKRSQPSLGM